MRLASNARSKITPPELAREWGIDVAKVLTWIRRGELRAINAATDRNGRPRYLIDRADLALFEAARSAGPQPKISRVRRRKDPNYIEYF